MKKLLFIVVALMAMLIQGIYAQKYYVSSLSKAGAVGFSYDWPANEVTIGKDAAQVAIPFFCDQSIRVACSEEWCDASIENSKILVNCLANNGDFREAIIKIYSKDVRGRQIIVNQLGQTPAIVVTPDSIEIGSSESVFTLHLSSSTHLKSVTKSDWLLPNNIDTEITTGTISITATALENCSEREGYITFETEDGQEATVKVVQRDKDALSFAVISDTHFGNSVGEGPMVKVPQALKHISSYKPLDALFIVGDLTDYGQAGQYSQFVSVLGDDATFTYPVDKFFFMMGNHDNFDASAKANYANGLKWFNMNAEYPLDQYAVIKGYPFITMSQRNGSNNDISNSANGTNAYPKEVQDSLKVWLARAANDCPGKPIFVFTHVPPRYTCYSSWPRIEGDGGSWDSWGMNVLNPILNDYPQVVAFCAHSHYPLADPRSIHQGVDPNSTRQNYYTVINTSSTTYGEINAPAVDVGNHPENYQYVTEGMIITSLPNGDIEIRRYDTYRNNEINRDSRWVLKAPFDGSMFEYADIRDADDNPLGKPLRDGMPAPVFKDDASVEVTPNAYSAMVTFPQASDNDCVFRYGVSAIKDGVKVKEKFIFSQYYLTSDMPESLTCKVTGLRPNENYTIEVTAYDSYGNTSTPLRSEFSTLEDTDPNNQVPERSGQWTFEDSDDLLKSVEGSAAIVPGVLNGATPMLKDGPADVNITQIEGPTEDNKAILLPAKSLFKMIHNEGSTVSNYTIQFDVKAESLSKYICLIQTTLDNSDDGDIFMNSRGTLGVGDLGYHGKIYANTWHRILLINKNSHVYLYLDGECITDGGGTRWDLAKDGVLLFCDNDGEELDIQVAELAYWNKPLTENQIANLGLIDVDNFINPSVSAITLYDKELDFTIPINSNVAPLFELPDWIEPIDAAPIVGHKDYAFRAKEMDIVGSRNGEIVISADNTETIRIPVTQNNSGGGVPIATGAWTFDDASNIFAGNGSVKLEAAKFVDGSLQAYADISQTDITMVDGPAESNKALHFVPKSLLKLTMAQAGITHRTYTLMYDVKPDNLSGYKAIFQTNMSNRNDADLFIKNNNVGLNNYGLGYNGVLEEGKWHRIVAVVKEASMTLYLDGVKIGESTSSAGLWEIDDYALLFADEDGEEGPLSLAEFRYWDLALTDDQVSQLGQVEQ